jgi:uncharacterized protein (TIGR03118 family)
MRGGGGERLYATDFHNAKIDVYDEGWRSVELADGAFVDKNLPRGFAPFGIRAIDERLFVTYALQDEDAEDDVAGKGLGVVDAYDLDGRSMARIVTGVHLDAPWGLAMSPDDFGALGGMLLVGNFGDGHITELNPKDGTIIGQLMTADNAPVVIDGLWGLAIGTASGVQSAQPGGVYFVSGPQDEAHGVFGVITIATTAMPGPGSGMGSSMGM